MIDKLPLAPQQNEAWTAPAGEVPEDVVVATTRLFQQGLADPRGCEYRAISAGVGSCWSGDGGVMDCHGWVLPAADAKSPRFVICWNGLIYPAISVGDKADLSADLDQIIKADETARAEAAKRDPSFPFIRFSAACPGEAQSVSEKSMLPIKVCMLLRLGNGDLAARYWKCWKGPAAETNEKSDAYRELAGALKWSVFDRAICAHMRGDDRLALLSAKQALTLKETIDKAPAAKAAENRNGGDRGDYADVLPALIEDDQRRVKETTRVEAIKWGEKAFAGRADWVAALVKDLDQVAARQWGQPGGVDLASDPVVQALIQCGDDAVEPLLDCLEHDKRLTRSVHFWRDFSPNRMPLGVHEAAYVALSGILQTSFFGTASTGDDLSARGDTGRAEVAGRIREYWKKYRGLTIQERWFRILADDDSSPDQWLQSMSNITKPVDVTISPSSMFGSGWVTTPKRMPGEKPALSGEVLRAKQNPSIVELAAKRIDQIDQLDTDSSQHMYRVASASEMALELHEWDAAKSVPVMSKQLRYAVGLFDDKFSSDYGEPMLTGIAAMARAMAQEGDHSGLKIYGDWLRTKVSPSRIGTRPEEVLSALWKFQDDPAMIETAEKMFNGPPSDWNPMLPHVITGWGQDDLVRSPLLGIKSFRDQVLRGLADQTPYATITIRANHEIETKTQSGNGSSLSSSSVELGEAHIAPEGTSMPLRNCDKYAYQISLIQGAPDVQNYWPQADRDAAIKACSEFLVSYAPSLRYNEKYQFGDDFPMKQACHLTFPPLGHPASLAETRSHCAIFSLEGQGDRRLFKLPDVPMKATWVALKKYPFNQQSFDTVKNQSIVTKAFHQESWVWQAEEVQVNGVWQRYYGVVGPHEIARVPASEIEFPRDWWDWPSLPGGTDCRIQFSEDATVTTNAGGIFALGKPVPIHLLFRNRLGVSQNIPTQWAAYSAEGKLAIRPGLSINLRRLSDTSGPREEGTDAGSPVDGKPLAILSDRLVENRMVNTNNSFEAAAIDLRDCFDLTKPGRYHVQLTFSKKTGLGEGSSQQLTFEIK